MLKRLTTSILLLYNVIMITVWNTNFLGYKEIAKLAEDVKKIGFHSADSWTIDASEVGLNLLNTHLHGVSVDWSAVDSPKSLMIKITAPRLGLTGRIHVRKMTAAEKSEYFG